MVDWLKKKTVPDKILLSKANWKRIVRITRKNDIKNDCRRKLRKEVFFVWNCITKREKFFAATFNTVSQRMLFLGNDRWQSYHCFVNNSSIVRKCHRRLELLSGRFSSVSLVWVPGHSNILTSSPQLVPCFRKSLQLKWVCHLSRSRPI